MAGASPASDPAGVKKTPSFLSFVSSVSCASARKAEISLIA